MNRQQLSLVISTIARLRWEGAARSLFMFSLPEDMSEEEKNTRWRQIKMTREEGIMEETINQINSLVGEGLTNSEELRLWIQEMIRNDMAVTAVTKMDFNNIFCSWWPDKNKYPNFYKDVAERLKTARNLNDWEIEELLRT